MRNFVESFFEVHIYMQSICPPKSKLRVHSSIIFNNCKTVDLPVSHTWLIAGSVYSKLKSQWIRPMISELMTSPGCHVSERPRTAWCPLICRWTGFPSTSDESLPSCSVRWEQKPPTPLSCRTSFLSLPLTTECTDTAHLLVRTVYSLNIHKTIIIRYISGRRPAWLHSDGNRRNR